MSLTSMLAAAGRLLTFYNGDEYSQDGNPGGLTGPDAMATNWDPCIQDIGTVAQGMGDVYTDLSAKTAAAGASATAAAGSAAAAETTRAATQTLLTQGQTTVQGLVTQAQAARDSSAASAVQAQQSVGSASNVIIPAINYRLASAWDANGNPTAYALSGVVAVHRYDTRLDWDRGAWRKGKLARASSWYNETLNTATRGSKREFPVVALVVTTATQIIIYDLTDLDANASPRMWMVFVRGGSFTSWTANTLWIISAGTAGRGAKMLGGRLILWSAAGGLTTVNFTRDRAFLQTDGVRKGYGGTVADRNAGKGYTQDTSEAGFLVHYDVTDADLRVLPGAPLDPVSRLPIPTIAVATAGGVNVIHATGLVATISSGASIFSRFTKDNRLCWGTTSTYFYVGPVPYTNYANSNALATEYYCRGDFAPVNGAGLRYIGGNQNSAVCLTEGAVGHPGGLTLLERDAANPANGMISYVSKDFATGWLPGDTRLCVITEGASSGASVTGTITDRSCKAKTLNIAGTLTRTAVGVNSDLAWLSGYSATNYASLPYSSDYDFGTGDCFFSFWLMNGNNGGDFFDRYSGSGARIRALVNTGKLNFFLYDGANSVSVSSTTDVGSTTSAGIARKVDLILRRATQTAEIWINGVMEASASTSALGSLTNTAATLTQGNTYALNNPLSLGSLCLFRAGAYAPAPNQIRRMYADEAVLFQAGAKAFLGGTSNSVQSLALDDDAGLLAVGTADGVSQFAGLRRVGRLTQAAGTAFTVASVTSLAAGGGALVIGTASEAGVATELMPVKDELRQAPAANSNDIVFEVTTTGAAPVVLGKLFVGEGEAMLIDLDVQGVEYGLTPADACSYSIKGPMRRSYGGNIQMPTTPLKIILSTTNAAMDVGMSADTAAQAVSFSVTGLLGKTMVWRGTARINRIGGVNAAA